jgi:predicted Zn-dependent peptidase
MPYIKKVLENGLRIVLVPLHDTQTALVMVLTETGSEYESKEKNGISHFLEHMCFKGTTNRPSSKLISAELDGMGAGHNAFTSGDYTGFYAKAHADKTEQMLDIISDMYLNSTFPAEEIEKEKGVVIEEINMKEDRPQSKVWEVLGTALYGDQPAGRTVLGTKETVSSFTREDLLAYHKEQYVPESTIVLIGGKIDADKVTSQVEALFGGIESRKKSERLKVREEQTEPCIALHHKKSDQVHIVLGFRSFINLYDEENMRPTGMLSAVLGRGMSSRLFTRIREDLGLAYYVGASHNAEIDYGLFTINLGVSKKNVTKALEAVFVELKKIKEELVGEEELRRVKDMRKGRFYLGLETSSDWAEFYGFQELNHQNIEEPEEIIAKREAITAEQIQEMAQKIFRPEVLTIAMVGPVDNEEEIRATISL